MLSTMPTSRGVRVCADRLHRQRMADQQMMTDLIRDATILDAWRKHAALMTEHRGHPRLVVSRERNDTITQALRDDRA